MRARSWMVLRGFLRGWQVHVRQGPWLPAAARVLRPARRVVTVLCGTFGLPLAIAAAVSACGGRLGGESETVDSAVADTVALPDVVKDTYDGRFSPDAESVACDKGGRCEGFAECFGGKVCCAGTIASTGQCLCGDGPGCDVRNRCCRSKRDPDGPMKCVLFEQCLDF